MKLFSRLAVLVFVFAFSGCASQKERTDKIMKKYGYNAKEWEMIKPFAMKYGEMQSRAFAQTSQFDRSPHVNARKKLEKIFCACTKKLGKSCLGSKKGVPKKLHNLWAKANAAYIEHEAHSDNVMLGTAGDTAIDPDLCL